MFRSGLRAFLRGGGAGDPLVMGGVDVSRLLFDRWLLVLFCDGGGAGASARPLT